MAKPYIQPRYSSVTPDAYERYAELGTQIYNERRRQEKETGKANRNSMFAQIVASVGSALLPSAAKWLFSGGAGAGASAAGSGASAGAGSALSGGAPTAAEIANIGNTGNSFLSTGAGSAGASSAEAAGTAAGSGGLASAGLGAAGIAAGAYTGYQQGKGVYNAMKGDDLDIQQQLALALPTFGASLLYNPVKNMFGSGKGEEQLGRDQWRGDWQDKGLLDSNYGLSLGSGTTNVGSEATPAGSNGYDVDWSNQQQKEAADSAIPLARILSGGDEKKTSDMTGYLSNAIMNSGQDPNAAAMELYKKFGFSDRNSAYGRVQQLENQGVLDKESANASYAEIDKLFGV